MVFDASHNKQHIDLCKDALVIDVSELEIIDTTKGARLVPAGSEADTPVFMLVPSEEVVGSGKLVDVSSLIGINFHWSMVRAGMLVMQVVKQSTCALGWCPTMVEKESVKAVYRISLRHNGRG